MLSDRLPDPRDEEGTSMVEVMVGMAMGMVVLAGLAMLLIVDISLALLGRLNSQLQLITLAFPIKMLVSLALLAWLVLVFPQVLAQASGPILRLIRQLLIG